ncbi:efflux RND transporter periplasmic adaptor subunit [Thalassotalea profundi]|uniref:RND transporter MFP subunit n=1 Tax=Thalassotalea profundi TaxID=2036687 RepID=A0ABQ3IVU8_9GAMM|nr:efflux RND transporter periplasmic adaptor subunit [Thalassotalea profundi]GHE92970.1 RND transporter MFP subunit [Thalassotalea profundi]
MRILFILLFTFMLNACSEQAVTAEKAIRPIAWVEVSESTIKQLRTLSGIVAPVEATQLSFEVSGKVETVDVRLGDAVEKGQILSQLNHRNFDLSLQSAQAQLDKANSALSEAKSSFERYSQLIKQGLVSQSVYDNAQASFDSSKSAVGVAQAQVDIANKNLQDSTLRAPYKGIITKRLIEPSQQISAGQGAFEIEGNHGLEVHVMVPETLIRELKKDTILPIRFPVLARVEMQGRITEIGTRAETANAFPVTVILQEDNPMLRAGMTAEVDFTFEGVGQTGYTGVTVAVPFSALRAGINQKTYTYVYNPQTQTVHQREVQTENVLNNIAFISSGLKSGEVVATAGVAFLRDGQKVTLLDQKTQRFN